MTEGLIKPLMHALMSRGFWERQRAAFFHIRVCHPNADSYKDLSPKQIYRIHENEKKRKYNSRVTEIEQGTFTPLVFTTTGGMADECLRYHSRLAELLSAKKQESYATTISWVRAKVSFAILRSALLCLRGSRTLFVTIRDYLSLLVTIRDYSQYSVVIRVLSLANDGRLVSIPAFVSRSRVSRRLLYIFFYHRYYKL